MGLGVRYIRGEVPGENNVDAVMFIENGILFIMLREQSMETPLLEVRDLNTLTTQKVDWGKRKPTFSPGLTVRFVDRLDRSLRPFIVVFQSHGDAISIKRKLRTKEPETEIAELDSLTLKELIRTTVRDPEFEEFRRTVKSILQQMKEN